MLPGRCHPPHGRDKAKRRRGGPAQQGGWWGDAWAGAGMMGGPRRRGAPAECAPSENLPRHPRAVVPRAGGRRPGRGRFDCAGGPAERGRRRERVLAVPRELVSQVLAPLDWGTEGPGSHYLAVALLADLLGSADRAGIRAALPFLRRFLSRLPRDDFEIGETIFRALIETVSPAATGAPQGSCRRRGDGPTCRGRDGATDCGDSGLRRRRGGLPCRVMSPTDACRVMSLVNPRSCRSTRAGVCQRAFCGQKGR